MSLLHAFNALLPNAADATNSKAVAGVRSEKASASVMSTLDMSIDTIATIKTIIIKKTIIQ